MEEYYQRYADVEFPKSKLLLWTKQGLSSFHGPPSIVFPPQGPEAVKVDPDPSMTMLYNVKKPPVMSPNGAVVALISDSANDVRVLNAENGEDIVTVSCEHTEYVEFSPRGTFFVTWSRPVKSRDGSVTGSTDGNLRVWRTCGGDCIASFNQKIQKRGVVQWNSNETVFVKLGTNELQKYQHDSSSGALVRCGKFHLKGISQFSLCPLLSSPYVAAFTPENSGKPAKVSILRYYLGEEGGTHDSFVDMGISRTLFSASECKMFWNPVDGASVLVQTQSDVDSSGGSYYGASGLFLVSVDGAVCKPVPQSKDGHVYSVQWSPDGSCFIMAAGRMPCHVTLFSPMGEPVYEFGALYRDSISWSPHGRFLCLAGFGNLGGDMNFYEITSSKKKQIGTASSHGAISWGWSPDSRYFMTCTTAPRMNVDNGFKIFKYNGEGPLVDHKHDVVYDVQWRPSVASAYPDRGRSPSRQPSNSAAEACAEKGKPSNQTPVAVKAPYRPPGSTGSLSAMMQREKGPKGKVSAQSTSTSKPKAAAPVPPRRQIPGMPPPPPVAASSSKKTKNKKVATSAPMKEGTNPPSSAAEAPNTASSVAESPTVVDFDKKIKGVQKKLKQIAELKSKKEAGADLDEGQISKMATEDALCEELRRLQLERR